MRGRTWAMASAVALLGAVGVADAAAPAGPIAGEDIEPRPPGKVDLVLAIDGTGSMFDEVFAAKAAAMLAIDSYVLANPLGMLRVGVVVYRDTVDERRIETFDLSPDVGAARAFLAGVVPGGGGDRRESVYFGLQTAVKEMAWDPDENTPKSVLVIGDAPSKTYKGELGLKKIAAEARKASITLNAIAISDADDTLAEFNKIAMLGGGSFRRVPPPPKRTDIPRVELPPGRDVMFVVDTTGSMGGSIAAVRRKVAALAKSEFLASAGGDSKLQEWSSVRFGLVDYRDRGDAWVAKMRVPLTTDFGTFMAAVNKLRAGGGGDWPESVTKAMMVALDKRAGWSYEASKSMVLVGDAEPHRYKGEPHYETVAKEAGVRNIPINTVACSGGSEVRPFKKIAELSGGKMYRLKSLGAAVDASVKGE